MIEHIGDWAPAYIGAIVGIIVLVIIPVRFIYLWAIGRKSNKAVYPHRHHMVLMDHTEQNIYWVCAKHCPENFEARWDRQHYNKMTLQGHIPKIVCHGDMPNRTYYEGPNV